MPRIWLPLILLAVVVVGLTLFLTSGDPETPWDEEDETVAVQEEELEAAPTLVAKETPDEAAPSGLERITLDLPDTRPKPKYASPAEEGEGFVVAVIDGNTSEPIPHAEVMVLDTGVADMRMVEVEMQMKPDFEDLFVTFGITYLADARGKVRVPEIVDEVLIAGRTPTHFNFDFDVDTTEDEVVLRLNPVELLEVKVVDELGRPVEGAPVALRIREEYWTQDLMKVHSDAEGFAKLKIFDLLKMQLSSQDTYAALQVLAEVPVEAQVDLKELPKEPPVLVLPESGQVEVRVLDEDGDLTEDRYFVRLELLAPGEMGLETTAEDRWDTGNEALVTPSLDGIAHFPLVEFGREYRATAYSSDQERTAFVEGVGPIPGGGVVVLEVAPVVERPVLVGRILNEEGMVGANLTLQSRVEVESSNGNSSTTVGQVRTDEKGVFRQVMDSGYEAGDRITLTITMRKTKRKPMRTVQVMLQHDLPPGDHDLGDLVVTEPPLIADGIVLGGDGEPLGNVEVSLEVETRYGQGPDEVYWNNLWELRTQTDRDGSFSIRGRLDDGHYRIRANHAKHLDLHREIDLGATGIELHMQAGLIVKGRFLLDPGIDTRALAFYTEDPEDTQEHHFWRGNTDLKQDGSFHIESQEPGHIMLVLASQFPGGKVHTQEFLLQPQEDGVQDLGVIDLRGLLTHFSLTVVDTDGNRIEDVKVQGPDQSWPNYSHEQPIEIVVADTLESLVVSAEGYRSVVLEHPDHDQEVVLQDGYPIRVTVGNPGAIPAGWEIQAILMRTIDEMHEDQVGTQDYHFLGTITSQPFEAKLTSAGTYRLQLTMMRLEEEEEDAFAPVRMSTQAPVLVGDHEGQPQFHVEDTLGLQEFHLVLDPQDVADARALSEQIEREGG